MADADQARAYFADVVDREFDTTEPLSWKYVLNGVKEEQLVPLKKLLSELGFKDICKGLDDDHVQKRYLVWFDEVCIHTADSYADRVAAIAALAKRERVGFSDLSADLPREVDPNPESPPLWLRPLAMMIELPRQSTPVRIVASLVMLAALLAVIAGIITRKIPLPCLILVVILASGLGYTWCAPRSNPGVDPTPID